MGAIPKTSKLIINKSLSEKLKKATHEQLTMTVKSLIKVLASVIQLRKWKMFRLLQGEIETISTETGPLL